MPYRIRQIEGRYNYRPPFDEPMLLPEKEGQPEQIDLIKFLAPYEGKRIRILIMPVGK